MRSYRLENYVRAYWAETLASHDDSHEDVTFVHRALVDPLAHGWSRAIFQIVWC